MTTLQEMSYQNMDKLKLVLEMGNWYLTKSKPSITLSRETKSPPHLGIMHPLVSSHAQTPLMPIITHDHTRNPQIPHLSAYPLFVGLFPLPPLSRLLCIAASRLSSRRDISSTVNAHPLVSANFIPHDVYLGRSLCV